MLVPIGLFHPATEVIRQGAELSALDIVGLIVAVCVLSCALILCPRG